MIKTETTWSQTNCGHLDHIHFILFYFVCLWRTLPPLCLQTLLCHFSVNCLFIHSWVTYTGISEFIASSADPTVLSLQHVCWKLMTDRIFCTVSRYENKEVNVQRDDWLSLTSQLTYLLSLHFYLFLFIIYFVFSVFNTAVYLSQKSLWILNLQQSMTNSCYLNVTILFTIEKCHQKWSEQALSIIKYNLFTNIAVNLVKSNITKFTCF